MGELLKFYINGKEYTTEPGKTVLETLRDNGFYVPTLCYHPALSAVGSCRVCVVEVEGSKNLSPACTTRVTDGMKINMNTERVKNAIKFNLSLLLSRHPNECMNCFVDGRCEFQALINRYNIEDMFPKAIREYPVDESSPSLFRDMDKCINCGRCVRACEELQGLSILSAVERGYETLPLPAFGLPIAFTDCINCGQCSAVCPTGAITERQDFRRVLNALERHDKVLVCQTAPAVRVAIAEEFGAEPGTISIGQMVAAIRRLGFDYVFDTNFAADLTIMEEGSELLERVKTGGKFPMFTSCCPGWVNLMEKLYPEYTENLSSAKSPHEMMGALVKSYFAEKIGKKAEDIMVISIMPCTAKKDEATREQLRANGVPDVDAVLTTRELAKLIRMNNIPFFSLPEEEYDQPLGISTGAAALFAATGGVMEAALRTAYELYTGKELPRLDFNEVRGLRGIKAAEIDMNGTKLKVAVAHGGANVVNLLEKLKSGEVYYDFIEIMACPGGCIGGGGQPKSNDPNVLEKRMKAVYKIDSEITPIRKSHENPAIKKIYEEYLEHPLSHRSHHLLHTNYTNRKKKILERAKESAVES